jgi:hypothetical protein
MGVDKIFGGVWSEREKEGYDLAVLREVLRSPYSTIRYGVSLVTLGKVEVQNLADKKRQARQVRASSHSSVRSMGGTFGNVVGGRYLG